MRDDRYIRIGFPDQRPGFVAGAVLTVLTILGLVFWIMLFYREDAQSGRILTVEICVNVLTLAANVYTICRVGYDGFLRGYGITYLLNLVLAVIGLYIAGVGRFTGDGVQELEAIWRFFKLLWMSMLMALMPTFLISGLMWLIMSIFGSPRK